MSEITPRQVEALRLLSAGALHAIRAGYSDGSIKNPVVAVETIGALSTKGLVVVQLGRATLTKPGRALAKTLAAIASTNSTGGSTPCNRSNSRNKTSSSRRTSPNTCRSRRT